MIIKKPFNRIDRVGKEILDILGFIILKHIDLSNLGFITFTQIYISKDLKNAKVFYSVLNPKKSIDEINISLNKKKKVFKKYLGLQLTMKNIPDVKFYYDETLDYMTKINTLLKDVN